MSGVVSGHVVVRARALEHVFGALAAKTLGVLPKDVSVRISDDRGLLKVAIRAPYADRRTSVVDAAAAVQRVIREEGTDLTGAAIGTVSVRITDVVASPRRSLA